MSNKEATQSTDGQFPQQTNSNSTKKLKIDTEDIAAKIRNRSKTRKKKSI